MNNTLYGELISLNKHLCDSYGACTQAQKTNVSLSGCPLLGYHGLVRERCLRSCIVWSVMKLISKCNRVD